MQVIKDCFEIKDDIKDLAQYVKSNKSKIDALMYFGNINNILINIGMAKSGEKVCTYKIIKRTAEECEETLSEFKKQLKTVFDKIETEKYKENKQ